MSLRKQSILSLIIILFLMIFIQNHAGAQTPSQSVSLAFNGTNNNFKIPSSIDFRIGDFTLETWAMIDGIDSNLAQLISKKKLDDQWIELQVRPNGSAEVIIGNAINWYTYILSPANTVTFGAYHHYAVVRSGIKMILYIDGVQVGTGTIPSGLDISNASDWFIGSEVNGTEFVKGSVAELRFWNKARTIDEIRGTINQSLIGNETNLVGYWKFDTVTTELAFDQSSNNNHGVGYNYSTPLNLNASNIDDLGMNLAWNSVTGATSYELSRDGAMIYDGASTGYIENALVSDTTYNYSIQAKNTNGKSVGKAQAFKTNVGELSLISVPTAFSLNPITLNGVSQKSYGTFGSKIVVKDTRKIRDGWNLTVKASALKSTDALRTFPNNKIQLKPVSNITQTKGKIASSASIINALQTIDGASPMKIVSASASTGQGVYEIMLPANALELTIDPANAYAKNYETNLTWSLVPGIN